mmetsp:Transcript_32332/g.52232  ORF Transcript_32332/g.52232 Transcript_32332/m.52232 type:complete len:271 (-) Transcript_32332:352-1164(-)
MHYAHILKSLVVAKIQKFIQNISRLISDESLRSTTDVTFVVSSGADSQEFFAHRAILIVQSPVFARLLDDSMPWKESKTRRIEINDTSPEAFDVFLKFVYSACVGWGTSVELLVEAAEIAHRYQVFGMGLCVAEGIYARLSKQNVLSCVELSVANQCIIEQCAKFVVDNWTDMFSKMKDMKWDDLYHLAKFMKMPKADREIDKFCLLKNWLDCHGKPDEDVVLDDVINLRTIRDNRPKDISKIIEPSGLFSKDALIEVYRDAFHSFFRIT